VVEVTAHRLGLGVPGLGHVLTIEPQLGLQGVKGFWLPWEARSRSAVLPRGRIPRRRSCSATSGSASR
jgi:hypothetical protein